jgi:GAF domain-containing protein
MAMRVPGRARAASIRQAPPIAVPSSTLFGIPEKNMFSGLVDRDFIANLVRLAGESARADGSTLYVLDPTGRFLKPFTVHKLPESYISGIGVVAVGTQCCGRAVAHRKPWIVSDMLSDPLFKDGVKGAEASDIRAGFSVPVIAHNGIAVGSLACHFRRPHTPTRTEIERNQSFATLIAHGLEHPTAAKDGWRELFEAVLRERNPDALPALIKEARTGILNRLELSSSGGTPADDETLADALRVLRDVEESMHNLW